MREIKFRIWNGKDGFVTDGFVKANLFNILETNPQHVQQFTGLLDRHGKEIYEGDILVMDEKEFGGKSPKIVVEFKDGYFDCNWSKLDLENWCEVIGNIYEHPHLLKGDKS